MQISLYRNTTPINHLTRSLSLIGTLSGTLREACDILNPDIQIEYDASFISANYAYIPAFNRYYFYTEPPTINGKTMILHLHSDALYNYRNVVLISDCIAERSSSDYNLKLPDSAVTYESGGNYFSGVLPYTFTPNNGSFILTVAGG